MPFKTTAKWPITAKRATLIAWDKKVEKKTLEEYKEEQIKQHSRLYANYSDSQFKKMQDEYYDYAAKFLGCCKIGDKVSLNKHNHPSQLVISKNWRGQVSDHEDLILELYRERPYYFPFSGPYYCEIFHLGTISVFEGSIEAQMGERPGAKRISHSDGVFKVSFDNSNRMTLFGGNWSKRTAIFQLDN